MRFQLVSAALTPAPEGGSCGSARCGRGVRLSVPSGRRALLLPAMAGLGFPVDRSCPPHLASQIEIALFSDAQARSSHPLFDS